MTALDADAGSLIAGVARFAGDKITIDLARWRGDTEVRRRALGATAATWPADLCNSAGRGDDRTAGTTCATRSSAERGLERVHCRATGELGDLCHEPLDCLVHFILESLILSSLKSQHQIR